MMKRVHEINKDETVAECDNSQKTYSYYSNVLNKPFTTVAELQEAESKYFAAKAEKEKASETRKNDAKKVEDAFKAMNAAKRTRSEKIAKARELYVQALGEAKKAYDEVVKVNDEALTAATKNYEEALKAFIATHKEGYHLTLKDGDTVTTLSGTGFNETAAKEDARSVVGVVNQLLNDIFRNF